jgi:hypothetical protein
MALLAARPITQLPVLAQPTSALLQDSSSSNIALKISMTPPHRSGPKRPRQVCKRCGLLERGGFQKGGANRGRKRRAMQAARCSLQTATNIKQDKEWGELEQPNWSGDDPISKVINALIGFEPLYSLMKAGARHIMIRWELC